MDEHPKKRYTTQKSRPQVKSRKSIPGKNHKINTFYNTITHFNTNDSFIFILERVSHRSLVTEL